MLIHPMNPVAARTLLRQIVATGTVFFDSHVQKRMAQRKVTAADVLRVLRGGQMGEAEFENGSWRYPVRGLRLLVVVAFDDETHAAVVTVVKEG